MNRSRLGKLAMMAATGLAMATLAAHVLGEELAWKKLPAIPDAVGFAGSFAGVSNGTLLVAGGANFPDQLPFKGGSKKWHARVFALDKADGEWQLAGELPAPRGYGASITTPDGVLLIGGSNAQGHTAEVLRMTWKDGRLAFTLHSKLPAPMANLSGALVGDTIYLAGGIETPDATKALDTFLACDLKAAEQTWRKLPTWPGRERMLATAAANDGAFYLFSGAALQADPAGRLERDWLLDAYRYRPAEGWKRLADLPRVAVAAPSPGPVLGGRLLVLGGDDGTQLKLSNAEHRGFPRDALAYDPGSDRWQIIPEKMPFSLVTTSTAIWQGRVVVPGGEIQPGVRSTEVWSMPLRK